MSGAETARCRVVQRRIGGAETAAPKCPSPHMIALNLIEFYIAYIPPRHAQIDRLEAWALHFWSRRAALFIYCYSFAVIYSHLYFKNKYIYLYLFSISYTSQNTMQQLCECKRNTHIIKYDSFLFSTLGQKYLSSFHVSLFLLYILCAKIFPVQNNVGVPEYFIIIPGGVISDWVSFSDWRNFLLTSLFRNENFNKFWLRLFEVGTSTNSDVGDVYRLPKPNFGMAY